MPNDIVLRVNYEGVDWDVLAEIYRNAPLGSPDPSALKRSYSNSDICCFAYQADELIGAGRAISDGETFATVCDIVVAKTHQRHGVGRAILESILERLHVPKVILACVQGQEEFYRKVGFLRHRSVMALYENSEWFLENGYLE